MQAAKTFFRSAKATMGFLPDRVTTDGHGSYPRAIRAVLGRSVRHRTSAYLTDVFDNPFSWRSCYFVRARVTAWPRAAIGMEDRHAAYDVRFPLAVSVPPAGGLFCHVWTNRV
jgi:transposase-like protein